MEYYSAIKRNRILIHATIQTNWENTMLSERMTEEPQPGLASQYNWVERMKATITNQCRRGGVSLTQENGYIVLHRANNTTSSHGATKIWDLGSLLCPKWTRLHLFKQGPAVSQRRMIEWSAAYLCVIFYLTLILEKKKCRIMFHIC